MMIPRILMLLALTCALLVGRAARAQMQACAAKVDIDTKPPACAVGAAGVEFEHVSQAELLLPPGSKPPEFIAFDRVPKVVSGKTGKAQFFHSGELVEIAVIDNGGIPQLTVSHLKLPECAKLLEEPKKIPDDRADCWLEGALTQVEGKPASFKVAGEDKEQLSIAILGNVEGSFESTNGSFKVSVKAKLADKSKGILKLTLAKSGGEEKPAPQASECAASTFSWDNAGKSTLADECKKKGWLCISAAGETINEPELSEGKALTVALLHPQASHLSFELSVEFKATRIRERSSEKLFQEHAGYVFVNDLKEDVRLTSAGKLAIKTKVSARSSANAKFESGNCELRTPIEQELTFTVSGHYHFMLGLMPTYAGLFSRSYTLHRSDDGVQRIFQQNERSVDLALTLTGYPWGVYDTDTAALGIVLGTSLRDLGKRWYLGAQLASPIGLGISGGAALIRVPALDADFVSGQPLTDVRVPTHDSVEVTWFVGVNVEAELFRRAFAGLGGDNHDN